MPVIVSLIGRACWGLKVHQSDAKRMQPNVKYQYAYFNGGQVICTQSQNKNTNNNNNIRCEIWLFCSGHVSYIIRNTEGTKSVPALHLQPMTSRQTTTKPTLETKSYHKFCSLSPFAISERARVRCINVLISPGNMEALEGNF